MQPEIAVQRDIARYQMESQSPYGAKWSATTIIDLEYDEFVAKSQSPCGAKRFATSEEEAVKAFAKRAVAIPLRGYVVCNGCARGVLVPIRGVAIPLRG